MKEKIEIVGETADSIGVDGRTKAAAQMAAAIGANDSAINILIAGSNRMETEKADAATPTPETPDYNEIEKIIADMMNENTGVHMMDSGGAYGRSWQRNRHEIDFRRREPLSVEVWSDNEVCFNLDIFHYLTAFLDTDENTEELERRFRGYLERNNEYASYGTTNKFIEEINDAGECHSFNSYNGESMLSQVIQGIWFVYKPDGYNDDLFHGLNTYLALRIHNGADVRGGYTRPIFFKVEEPSYMIMAESNINASCECLQAYTDDIYHWYSDDNQLEDNKLPAQWKPTDGDDKPRQYTSDNGLQCSKCGAWIKFNCSLDW